MPRTRSVLIWTTLAAAITIPVAAAAVSPQLAWRDPIYIAAGFAGVIAMPLLLLQPLLAGRYLPGLSAPQSRRVHRALGIALVTAVILHVGALWITSPPDVIDVLLFRSPTPFAVWGAIAMWAVFAAAALAAFRKRLGLRFRPWRIAHITLAIITVIGSVTHAMLIEGTMETLSKAALCALALGATLKLTSDLWRNRVRSGS